MIGSFWQALQEPLLAADEEREAILKWQGDQDAASLELLVRSHARQVWSHARKWTDNPSQVEDLVAEGMVGLIRAADKFDTARGVRFSTYAAWWIRNEVFSAIKRERASSVPGWIEATPKSDEAALSDESRSVNFHESVEVEELQSEEASPEEDALRRSDEASIAMRLADAMKCLNAMESEVIRRRRLTSEPEPFDLIARDLNASPARLRQIENRAMSRLRQGLLAQGFSLSVFH
ncbi:sigma-70 family RNA polymerase sigma factor [Roseivivax sp. CAU 1753]